MQSVVTNPLKNSKFTHIFIAFVFVVSNLLLPLVAFTHSVSAERIDAEYADTRIIGGTGDDGVSRVTIDSSGNTYMVGSFQGTVDFDPGAATDTKVSVGNSDIFISKYTAGGSYVYTKAVGGVGLDGGQSIAVDSADNLYVIGYFENSFDANPGAATDTKVSAGDSDLFVTKYNSSGTYVDTKSIGGTGQDGVTSLTIASDDSVYLAGYFASTVDFDPGMGIDNKVGAGAADAFFTKFNADGSYAYTNIFSGAGDTEYVISIAFDVNDNMYVSGDFSSAIDFDPGVGSDIKTPTGLINGYLAKFNADGSYSNTLVIEGDLFALCGMIQFDSSGNLYLAGTFKGSADFNPGAGTDNRIVPSFNMFLMKFNSSGNYVSTKLLGGQTNDDFAGGRSMAIDSYDNVYLASSLSGTVDFDPGVGIDNRTSLGVNDFALTMINADGSYGYTKIIGGPYDNGGSIALIDSDDNMYITGSFTGVVDFDPGGGVDERMSTGEFPYDGYMTKLTPLVYQQISGLPSGVSAKTVSGSTDAASSGVPEGETETVRMREGSVAIADTQVTFGSDLDWSAVTADSDPAAGKSFAHNLTSVPGAASSFALYIPKLPGSTGVGICPGADSLTDLTTSCPGYVEYLADDPRLSGVTIEGINYWKVTGLTGTGGLNIYTPGAPNSGVGITTSSLLSSLTGIPAIGIGVMIIIVWRLTNRR